MIICDNDKIGDREKIVIPTQSSTNVTLPNKLRIFSHDLGYIYEKQRKDFFTYTSYIKRLTQASSRSKQWLYFKEEEQISDKLPSL